MANTDRVNIPQAARDELLGKLLDISEAMDALVYEHSDYMLNDEYTQFASAINAFNDAICDFNERKGIE